MRVLFLIIFLTAGLVLSLSCKRNDPEALVPPMAAVSVSPDTLFTTTMLRFDCSMSEPGNDQDKIYYRWDWNSDGIWDEEFSNDPVFMHRFYSKGTHNISMEALNSSGLTDTCIISLSVEQGYSAPRALFRITPESGNRITEFTFDASLTQDDEDSLDQLLFKWDWNGDGIWDTGFSSKAIVRHSYFETGSFQPVLEAIIQMIPIIYCFITGSLIWASP